MTLDEGMGKYTNSEGAVLLWYKLWYIFWVLTKSLKLLQFLTSFSLIFLNITVLGKICPMNPITSSDDIFPKCYKTRESIRKNLNWSYFILSCVSAILIIFVPFFATYIVEGLMTLVLPFVDPFLEESRDYNLSPL